MVKVSVITINRNGGAAVERTVASVRGQTAPCEWVVVDGGSTDGSVERMRAGLRDGDQLVSEHDDGIADAFNKGLARARSEVVVYMNAGDEFASPWALADLLAGWDRSCHRWVVGAVEMVGRGGRLLFRRSPTSTASAHDLVRHGCRICHQAVAAETALLREAGGFDPSFRRAMDYDLWCRLLAHGHEPQRSDVLVCRFYDGGVSGGVVARWREEALARRRSGLANPRLTEWRLAAIAHAKAALKGRVGGWAYHLKERLGW